MHPKDAQWLFYIVCGLILLAIATGIVKIVWGL